MTRGALWLVLALSAIGLSSTAQRASAEEYPPLLGVAEPGGLFQDDEFEKDAEAFEPNKDTQQAEGQEGDLRKLLLRIEKLEKAGAKKDDKKEKEPEWEDLSSDKWNVRMGGHIQMEYIMFPQASESIPNAFNYFEFRRLRLLAEGTGYGVYDFRLQMTLEPEAVGTSPPGIVTSPEVKDAYFTINEVPILGRIRAGNFFVPFGLEQVTNDTQNVFLERSIPTQGIFTADREVGLAVYNCTDDQNATISYGAFFDNISEGLKEQIDNNMGIRVSGRATWCPYYDEPTNGRYAVHTGVGVLYTYDQDDRVRFRARPEVHEGPFLVDTGNLAAKSYTVGNVEGAVVWGPVTLQSEAYITQVRQHNGDQPIFYGAYAHLSWFLTGENRNYERFGQHGAQFFRNSPHTNVFATQSGWGWGAWELKTRFSFLNVNDVNRGAIYDYTLGMNWYWSDRVRLMFDWIHPMTSAQALYGQTASDLLGIRLDFNW